MDKEVLVLEREELCKALAERSSQMEDLSKQLESLRGQDQRQMTAAEARESLEARASALREEVRCHSHCDCHVQARGECINALDSMPVLCIRQVFTHQTRVSSDMPTCSGASEF